MLLRNTLIDNSSPELSMSSYLKQCFRLDWVNRVRIATGYWDVPGMALVIKELSAFLEREGTMLQILIGKDPYVYSSLLKNPKYQDASFPHDFIRTDIHNLELHEEYMQVIKLLLKHCESSKIQIRIYLRNAQGEIEFLHSKCYICSGEDDSLGIIGSSNFTGRGLIGNAELNYLESDSRVVTAKPQKGSAAKGHSHWFDEKWTIAEDWSQEFLEQVVKTAPIAQETMKSAKQEMQEQSLSPYELYIKLLQYKFCSLVDKDLNEILTGYLPSTFDAFEYQLDAVKQCYSIMQEHGGFMLSDVVGLGKTVVGTLLVKHFLSMPEDDGRNKRVLIITPPAILETWRETIDLFDVDKPESIAPSIDFVTMGSISKLVDDIEDEDELNLEELDSGEFIEPLPCANYGLILIDESHRLRNNHTQMYQSLDNLIEQIVLQEGTYPYIGLLSATPQNNRPDDLKHQIYLFQRNHTDSTLRKANGGNLESFFADIAREYQSVIHSRYDKGPTAEQIQQNRRLLNDLSSRVRDCVLQDILVRRTRTDIRKYYPETKLSFPEISGPHSFEYRMSKSLAKLFARTMDCIAPKENFQFDSSTSLCYYRYRAIEYLRDESTRKLYSGRNMDAERFSHQLARIMQIGLVKRIESSFSAFKVSLKNLKRYTQNMVDMWEHNTIFICPQIDVNAELNPRKHWDSTGKLTTFEECAEDLRKKINKLNSSGSNEKGRNREYRREDFAPEYIDLLRQDLALIDQLDEQWSIYSDDPKLDEFKRQLLPSLLSLERNPEQKLVIFTEAIDTVRAIERAIESVDDELSVLSITAKNRREREEDIRANFDANYKGGQRDDYQIIITTEVLAEGINLHRANSILNYDTPWNATRLMQRIGRVNRIGSQAPCVYVYNFMPSAEGDAEINLVKKAYTKLQSFHTLFGEDSQIFSDEEEVVHHELKTQIEGAESALEQYLYELKTYKAQHPERYDYIAQQSEGLELAVSKTEGQALFVVCSPKCPAMFVRYDALEDKCSMLSAPQMYEAFRSATFGAQAFALPKDWQAQRDAAVLAVNQALVKRNLNMKRSARATEAKAIIDQMKEMPMEAHSRKLLASARKLVDKGNPDIIKRIIGIGHLLKEREGSLLPITQDEIDTIIHKEIEILVSGIAKKFGQAEVFIGLSL